MNENSHSDVILLLSTVKNLHEKKGYKIEKLKKNSKVFKPKTKQKIVQSVLSRNLESINQSPLYLGGLYYMGFDCEIAFVALFA